MNVQCGLVTDHDCDYSVEGADGATLVDEILAHIGRNHPGADERSEHVVRLRARIEDLLSGGTGNVSQ